MHYKANCIVLHSTKYYINIKCPSLSQNEERKYLNIQSYILLNSLPNNQFQFESIIHEHLLPYLLFAYEPNYSLDLTNGSLDSSRDRVKLGSIMF